MQGGNKALQDLAGRPLLQHVIARMRPQCGQLLLSVERISEEWNDFGLTQVADFECGSNGPLGGLLAALEFSKTQSEQLLLVPCDAPFLPMNLAQELTKAMTSANCTAALVVCAGQWQPTFSLWHTEVLPDLRKAVRKGQKGFKEFLQGQSPAVLVWPEQQVSPFFNVNSAEDLAAAAALLDLHGEPIS